MKRTLAIVILVPLLVGSLWLLLARDSRRPSREWVQEAARLHDPNQLPLTEGFNRYVRRSVLSDGIECGVITLKDRTEVSYWFASHHHSRDIGAALFRLPSGVDRIMAGCFCCEVQFPEEPFAEEKDLVAFITRHDNQLP